MSMSLKGPFPIEGTKDFGPTLCKQSEAAGTDINVVIKHFVKTGFFPPPVREAIFTDVSEFGDFRQAVEVIRRAEEGFMSLPAEVRREFDNDAAAFVDFVQSASREQLERLGLVEETAAKPPVEGTPSGAP